jgi:hypothetical protein
MIQGSRLTRIAISLGYYRTRQGQAIAGILKNTASKDILLTEFMTSIPVSGGLPSLKPNRSLQAIRAKPAQCITCTEYLVTKKTFKQKIKQINV